MYHVSIKILSSTTVYYINNTVSYSPPQKLFLKDHVTIKTGVMEYIVLQRKGSDAKEQDSNDKPPPKCQLAGQRFGCQINC